MSELADKEKIEQLEKQLRLAEVVINKLTPYSANQRQMVDSYYRFKLES